MKICRQPIFYLTALLLIFFGFTHQIAVAAPVYIKNFSSFPAYPYNTTAYKQGGAFVGCGPTTGAMIMAYFHHVEGMSSTNGLLTNPGTGVDEGLNTAWTLHGSSYMNTGADGFGSVYNIEPGLENYATNRGYKVDVLIHVSPTYDPSSTAWQDYGPYGTSWLNDGDFWTYSGGVWGIDANKFCDFVGAKLAAGITIFLTIDTDLNGSGDHWVALVGYDKSTLKYAFYDTYSTTLQWADIYYCGATPRKDNSISFVRSVTYNGPIQQNNPPRDLVALTGYHAAVPLAWNQPAGLTLLALSTRLKTTESMDDAASFAATSNYYLDSGILSSWPDFVSSKTSPPTRQQSAVIAPIGYHVYRATSSSGYYTRIASNITRQYYRDETVTNGTTYYYKVTAVYSNGESGYSGIVSATPTANGYVINSKWTTTTPTLNGVINASEWSAASTVNILFPGASGTVTLYVMNNNSTLFLAVDDKRDTHINNTDQFAIFFDENLNREWPASGSSETEGNFWIAWDSTSSSSYTVFGPRQGYWPDNLIWPTRSTPAGVSHGISFSFGNVQYECSIHLSTSPLNAVIGNTIGLLVFTYDYYPKYFNSFWPQQAERLKVITPDINYWGQAPFSYGNLKLAASAATPDISCSPLTGDFGAIAVGGYQEKTFTIRNDGTADLIVSATTITGSDASQFSIQSGGGSFTLAPAGSRNLIVRFTPTSAGAKSASLSISSNDPDENPLVVSLSGTGTVPDISSNPASWNYGAVNIGNRSDKTFTIKNEGTANLSVTATTLTGTNASEFSIPSGGGAFTLAPSATRDIVVRFGPTSAGSKSASLSISSNDPDENPFLIMLSGTGTAVAGIPINPVATSPQMAGIEFWVSIDVGTNANPVTDLFGVSFDLNYTNTNYINYLASEAGAFMGSDVIFYPTSDDANGKVSIGISRKAPQAGVTGFGTVARVKLIADAATPNNTSIQLAIANVTANNSAGAAITLAPGSLTITIQSGLIVWPGDTNNNGLVDQADILPLGLYWGKTGPARQNASMAWSGQLATPWNPQAATYADATGDGSVNQADVLPIGFNWNKTHTGVLVTAELPAEQLRKGLTTARLVLADSGSTAPNQDFYLDIRVEGVSNLFGLSYELIYTPAAFIDPLTVELGPANIMGNDVIFFSVINDTAGQDSGKVSVGISRKFGQGGVTGSGRVTRIKAHMAATAVNHFSTTQLTVTKIQANDPNGIPIPIDSSAYNLITAIPTTAATEPVGFALYDNYPNPFNSATTIAFQLPQPAKVNLAIYDLQGHRVRALMSGDLLAGYHMIQWNGCDDRGNPRASGVYIIRIEAKTRASMQKTFFDSRKMILMK